MSKLHSYTGLGWGSGGEHFRESPCFTPHSGLAVFSLVSRFCLQLQAGVGEGWALTGGLLLSLPRSFPKARGQIKGPPAWRLRGGLGKNVNRRIFLNVFPAPVIRALKARGPEVSVALSQPTHKAVEGPKYASPPTLTCSHPGVNLGPQVEFHPVVLPLSVLLLWKVRVLRREPQRHGGASGLQGLVLGDPLVALSLHGACGHICGAVRVCPPQPPLLTFLSTSKLLQRRLWCVDAMGVQEPPAGLPRRVT